MFVVTLEGIHPAVYDTVTEYRLRYPALDVENYRVRHDRIFVIGIRPYRKRVIGNRVQDFDFSLDQGVPVDVFE